MKVSLWVTVAIGAFVGLVAAEGSASDYYVRSLPGLPEGSDVKMHAGNIIVDEAHNGALFFWHFANKHIADKQRTVIWLNGGPGCSSMDGALMEVGPFRLKDENTLVENEGSWHEYANLLFVDQPVGVGFSYVDTDSFLHELPEMSAQFLTFMDKFFAMFPEYEDDDIYIAGESYAGQYIPYIAKAVQDRNTNNKDAKHYNIAGLLIGNGWMDPATQYDAYLPFAYQNGILDQLSDDAKDVENQLAACKADLAKEMHIGNTKCEAVLDAVLKANRRMLDKTDCLNMYDVRLRDSWPACGMNWPQSLVYTQPYLRKPEVIKALNINADKRTGWVECTGAVTSTFKAQNSRPSREFLPELLKDMPVLLFAGDQDLICNYVGIESMINSMEWNGFTGFAGEDGNWATREPWEFAGESAGLYQSARNLTYVRFYNSSHMVPYDYPERTRDMLDRFMKIDISTIGGKASDSKIGGETGPAKSVEAISQDEATKVADEAERLKQATWKAYYRAGFVALLAVSVGAIGLGIFVWKQRMKEAQRGHMRRPSRSHILEEGYDENELDELVVQTPVFDTREEGMRGSLEDQSEERRNDDGENHDPFGDSDDEEDDDRKRLVKDSSTERK
ncbi:carboxypeptidase KEX1 [Saitoella complicata NRRL Y-17804]|uniref:carboxypeptidase KEX1 n=1 Tax=Saitoella complicata (strain BCRC 22490 / CBS 7301 / JCM 7358 / NBRC 10748 / NRRL Y-17804) TaxID=698492 RepID=UPI00086806CA|nr:carboxypeptidase KEX1 [Saitoella complicata NRRL Y-17804]ODQ52926.1 carboxypeptidase KEX1 [Saitoella complicata NRRL Y-17804]